MTPYPPAGAAETPDAASASAAGPDFLCVGLQKAGTQWLYDQLQLHPDFWMPPFKELHYFDRPFPSGRIAAATERYLADPRRYARRRERRGQRPMDERDGRFFAKVAACKGRPAELEAYAGLFAEKGPQIAGDVTPGYSTLTEPAIGPIARRFPAAKCVLLLRDPVERAWSAWRMSLGDAGKPAEAAQDAAAFARFLDRPATVARSYPTAVAARWRAAFGDRFRFFFLDDIAREPAAARAAVIAFLGGDPAKGSGFAPDFNRKAKAAPPYRCDAIKALMAARFAHERALCAAAFGGPALDWPDAPY